MIIRLERPDDATEIAGLTTRAFATADHSDGSEPAIIAALRRDGDLVLSLVAEATGEIVGHVAFSPAHVGGQAGCIALGPISVAPGMQRQGIGRQLVAAGLARLRDKGARGYVLLGDPAVYTRYGFVCDGRLSWRGIDPAYLLAFSFSDNAPVGEGSFAPAFDG